jgi:addiction module HigA family antidote
MIKREELEAGRVDLRGVVTGKRLPTIHPGEILEQEFLQPFEISQYRLAKAIGVSARRINEIVHRSRGITADTALRLAKYFGTTPEFWMSLQAAFDLEEAKASVNVAQIETLRAA